MFRKILILITIFYYLSYPGDSWIRINQLGYLPKSYKTAVLVSFNDLSLDKFVIFSALTDKPVYQSKNIKSFGEFKPFKSTFRLNFSDFTQKGSFYIIADGVKSPIFRISKDVYNGTADFLLNYMRQQRCGYNPFLRDSCHVEDGFVIYHPDPAIDSGYIDVRGGWHDASDYLQYVTTSANAVFQMLFAYEQNPQVFGDKYNDAGLPYPNNIPDILDEAKWGLDWLVRMNPANEQMYSQIADDRDHRGFRLPNEDNIVYAPGKNLARPVYFCTGKPQGAFKYQNRTTGIASIAGKYASAFIMGSEHLKKYYPEFSELLKKKAVEAYNFGLKHPGVNQTAPCVSPYFYEEDNYVDDMELAAAKLYKSLNGKSYLNNAVEFGKKEETTPWMGSDTARHYQWYPFINLGHYYLASDKDKSISSAFRNYLKDGLEKIYQRGKDNPFLIGIPFIWCSNNLVAAAITQSKLYNQLTGDKKYLDMEAALRDWLFGCNPWGTSMVIGLPNFGDYPEDPHSAFTRMANYQIPGGLVDGPVYGSIYNRLIGIKLYSEDEYKQFQSDYVVYHDDYGDYSTNEPTMDGTASLTYYLSALEKENYSVKPAVLKDRGAVIRTNSDDKNINLVFTGGDFGDGGEIILNTLKKHNIKASFFFTGDFYRNREFKSLINKLKKEGHYLGAHSDKHLLYASWEKRDSLLITKEKFIKDLSDNYKEMEKFGISPENADIFLPPYEWYNQLIADWCEELGIKLINFTPGTFSNADYTTPDMGSKYFSSDVIYNKILEYESTRPYGLNGFILLTHIGTDPKRIDKFYLKLDKLILELKNRGYNFKKVNETIN